MPDLQALAQRLLGKEKKPSAMSNEPCFEFTISYEP